MGEGGTNIIVLARIQLHSTGLDSVSPLSQMQGFYSHEWEQVCLSTEGLHRALFSASIKHRNRY